MSDNPVSQRAKAHFPTVLLTLLSIVQALALELLWGYLVEQNYLYEWTFPAILGWLQITATLLGILLIWLIYSDMVLRLSWLPRTIDAIFPFLVGILEFAQISALGASTIGLWFVLLAILFASMAWISQSSMKRARLASENKDFFENVQPATFRDHLLTIIPAMSIFILGISIWITENQGWFALVAVLSTIGLLGYQMWMSHLYTQRSYQK